MIELARANSNNEVEGLIDFNLNQGNLDYKVNSNVQHQDLSWLRVKNLVLQKEILKPPSKKKKVQRNDFQTKLVNSRSAAKGFLQNRQMGKASKKDWDTDIAYIRNVFAYLTVWLNPIRIEAKLGRYTYPLIAEWIFYMWDTMMSRALKEFIKQENIRSKLEWQIKESTALNKVHEFLAGANIGESLQNLIRLNRNFYRFMYSTCINIICMNTKEVQIQEQYVEGYSNSEATAQGVWIGQPMNNNYVPQYPPLPLNTVVEQKQINVDSLSENEKKEILKRQKLVQKRAKLEQKIDEMSALKRRQKLAERVFKNKKKI